jgi:hypothetical protein
VLPVPAGAGQNLIAALENDLGEGAAQALDHGAIQLEDAEGGIVHQDHVVNGVEGADPLAVRTENLLQQAQVLHCNANLVANGGQELQFIGRVRASPFLSQCEGADNRGLALDRHQQHVVKAFVANEGGVLRLEIGEVQHDGQTALHDAGAVAGVDIERGHRAQELLRQPDLAGDNEFLVLQQAKPGRAGAGEGLQPFQHGEHHGPVLLRAGDGGRDGIHRRQPGGVLLGITTQAEKANQDHPCLDQNQKKQNPDQQGVPEGNRTDDCKTHVQGASACQADGARHPGLIIFQGNTGSQQSYSGSV